jgi:hypothetical protein
VVVSRLIFIVNYEKQKFIFDKWAFNILFYIKVCVLKTFYLIFASKNYGFNFAGAQQKSIFNLKFSTDVKNLKVTNSNHVTYLSFIYFDILIPK